MQEAAGLQNTCQTVVMARTIVHLLRHGEVHNPAGVLYGRQPGYVLSELGMQMAQRIADHLGGKLDAPRADLTLLKASPLVRAQQTAGPVAAEFGLPIVNEPRVIEAGNRFEGLTFGVGDGSMFHPSHWFHLRNPFRPSWGEPYRQQVRRMADALYDAADEADGHEALIVSHQLPIWIIRTAFEGRRLWHDPRKRQCSLASLTSFHFFAGEFSHVTYSEPAADLLPARAGAGA